MSDFSADWLGLREPADRRARNAALAARLAAYFAGKAGMDVLDLGAGSGNNMVATASLLRAPQRWTLIDSDPDVLDAAARRVVPGVTVETRFADLSTDMELLLDPAPDLVTASAFFDLCGAPWIEAFAARLAASGAALYAVLNYDGREAWTPRHPEDSAVLAAFHKDQRRDKGLGPALGPDGQAHLARVMARHGYQIVEGASDWTLRQPEDGALIEALAEGSAAAVAPSIGKDVAARWLAARRRADRVLIGHRDLLALPPR